MAKVELNRELLALYRETDVNDINVREEDRKEQALERKQYRTERHDDLEATKRLKLDNFKLMMEMLTTKKLVEALTRCFFLTPDMLVTKKRDKSFQSFPSASRACICEQSALNVTSCHSRTLSSMHSLSIENDEGWVTAISDGLFCCPLNILFTCGRRKTSTAILGLHRSSSTIACFSMASRQCTSP